MTNMIIKYCTTIFLVQRRIRKILSVSEFYSIVYLSTIYCISIYIQKNIIIYIYNYIYKIKKGGYFIDLFYRNGTTQFFFFQKSKEIISKMKTNREKKPAIGIEPMTIALQMRCSNR